MAEDEPGCAGRDDQIGLGEPREGAGHVDAGRVNEVDAFEGGRAEAGSDGTRDLEQEVVAMRQQVGSAEHGGLSRRG